MHLKDFQQSEIQFILVLLGQIQSKINLKKIKSSQIENDYCPQIILVKYYFLMIERLVKVSIMDELMQKQY